MNYTEALLLLDRAHADYQARVLNIGTEHGQWISQNSRQHEDDTNATERMHAATLSELTEGYDAFLSAYKDASPDLIADAERGHLASRDGAQRIYEREIQRVEQRWIDSDARADAWLLCQLSIAKSDFNIALIDAMSQAQA